MEDYFRLTISRLEMIIRGIEKRADGGKSDVIHVLDIRRCIEALEILIKKYKK